MRIIRLRHRTSPPVGGCRWCGIYKTDHALRWVPGKKWHSFVEPTDAQRTARLLALRKAASEGFANPDRTRL